MRGVFRGLSLLLTLVVLPGSAVDLAGQDAGAQAADTAAVDSTRLRILEAARRLSRGPTPDSAIQRLADSARLAAELRGSGRGSARRGGRGGSRSGGPSDSVAQALTALSGYSVTRYEGREARFDARTRRLVLFSGEETQARVLREGMELSADSSVTYDEQAGRIRTEGGGTYTPEDGDPVQSRVMVFDLSEDRGTALGAETTYSQGAQWIMHGDLTSVSREATYGHDMRFTSCDLEIPHYHFQTSEIKIVNGNVLVARPVKLYFGDVPVAWLPFIAQGLGQDRSSGILPPRFSVNDIVQTSGGQRRRISNIGFYWAMSQYSDAEVALDWFSNEFVSLTGSLRYHWLRQFLRGSVNLRRFWREEGGTEFALDTRHNWEISERTSFRARASFASSTDFVRRNSFDPRELTQTIDSDAGLNRRFDWGNVSLSWNRRQSISTGEVNATLPSLNLSLSTITLFQAPQSRASWYNNVTWSGGMSYNRRTRTFDEEELPDTAGFSTSTADRVNTQVSADSRLTLGNFNFSQNLSLSEAVTRDVPSGTGLFPDSAEAGDFSETDLTWSMSLDYQQRLIGSTTITPSLSLNGKARRTDELEGASSSLIAAPTRLSFGARLKTDMYRFFPGFGSYAQVRHKVTPSFDYQYAPAVVPTDLQGQVFGSREAQAQNQVSVTLNQTFEAKVEEEEEADSARAGDEARPDTASGPRRLDRGEIVTLLSLQTSAVRYDFVQADSLGEFQAGITTTRLRNTIGSDFLRGMNVSMEHDLFQGTAAEDRSFDPHLSQLNLSFSFGASSSLFRWLQGVTGGEPAPEEAPEGQADEELDETDPFAGEGQDESQVIPLGGGRGVATTVTTRRGGRGRAGRRAGGAWNANVSYSLNRPRGEESASTQMLQGTLTFSPTERWDVNWRTSYDVENGAFNDHIVSLTRDLHRWEATFDFRQTAAGNWTFRFEVALTDNRDLKFDYEQRNIEDAGDTRFGRRF